MTTDTSAISGSFDGGGDRLGDAVGIGPEEQTVGREGLHHARHLLKGPTAEATALADGTRDERAHDLGARQLLELRAGPSGHLRDEEHPRPGAPDGAGRL